MFTRKKQRKYVHFLQRQLYTFFYVHIHAHVLLY
ncbi:hypothetical protein P879_10509 [Paragonimus westermani]|uniref:Uncharacterized protein n=1 Tax=Paragonimus westermani TaxID=34504 RepID=A0A8T0D8A6_9TREM|nr:hypothetical protein P879_10509 [Paragonimus westermani]